MLNEEYGKFDFRLLDDGTYEAIIVEYTKTLIIPDSYDGRTVSSVSAEKNAGGGPLVEEVLIPEGIERVGYRAFFPCIHIHAMTVPSSLRAIERDAFSIIGRISEVYVYDLSSFLSIDFGNENANPLRAGAKLFVGNDERSITRLVIPREVERIGAHALSGMHSLVSVTLHSGVRSVGEGAFSGCQKLVEIINPSAVELSGREDTAGVLNIARDESDSRLTHDESGFIFYTHEEECCLVGYEGSEREITLPDDYMGRPYSIYRYAFRYTDSLSKVTFGKRVTAIGEAAFTQCFLLGEIAFAEGCELREIGERAFLCCEWLGETRLPAGLLKIDRLAFAYCSLFDKVYIPKSVLEIATDSFEDCPNLTVLCERGEAPEGFRYGWDASVYEVLWGVTEE